MLYEKIAGEKIRYRTGDGSSDVSTPFTATEAEDTPIDPDVVIFNRIVNDGNQEIYTYTQNASPPDPEFVIVRLATGDYIAEFDSTGEEGTQVGWWECHPDALVNVDTTKTKTVGKPIQVVVKPVPST